MVPLSFASMEFLALADNALLWPEQGALLVADLHLEKASWYARSGQMLPPYDSRGNLDRLQSIIVEHDVQMVYSLGDNYHDVEGECRLERKAAGLLRQLTRQARWIWITGNHDRELSAPYGGEVSHSAWIGGKASDGPTGDILLCHEPEHHIDAPQICGHFHPKLRIRQRGRHVSRRCYTISENLLIMPSFGNLTGGLDAADEAIANAHAGQPYRALLPVRNRLTQFVIKSASIPECEAEMING